MNKGKQIREKGKIRLSEYFKELKKGDKVAIVKEAGLSSYFPKRMQGRTGIVEGKRGRACIVKLNDLNEAKTYIIEPIHLKRLDSK